MQQLHDSTETPAAEPGREVGKIYSRIREKKQKQAQNAVRYVCHICRLPIRNI